MTVLQGPLADRDSWSAVGGCPIEKTMAMVGSSTRICGSACGFSIEERVSPIATSEIF